MLDVLKSLEPIQIGLWEPADDRPPEESWGRVKWVGNRTRGEIFRELNEKLDAVGLNTGEGGVDLFPRYERNGADYVDHNAPELPWPNDYRWVACYTAGGSEGRWIHVALIQGDRHETLAYGKTFLGREHAELIALACQRLLDS